MAQPVWEVADILRRHGAAYCAQQTLPVHQLRMMRALQLCRTATLGGHIERCGHCDHQRISYNSCRNRHCPKCQNLARAQWIEKRKAELLPIAYFHIVFTIPEQLNPLALQNKKVFYDLLFATAAAALQTIARDPKHLGADIGFFSILHTWGQTLTHHPHIHSVVTGGGLRPDRSGWIHSRKRFCVSVNVLSRRFRKLLLEALHEAFQQHRLSFHGNLAPLAEPRVFYALLAPLVKRKWVVYAKPPFGGPQQVIDYLGRYTHRVAISNHRLKNVENGQVTFQYKQYRAKDGQQAREMTVSAQEFIRRFLLHTLPPGFQRIRHYGLLASRPKQGNLALCRQFLDMPAIRPSAAGERDKQVREQLLAPLLLCPQCRTGRLVRILFLPSATGPPPRMDTS